MMKKMKLLIGIILILCLTNGVFNSFFSKKEAFVTSNYNTCRSKGFSKAFCVQTPLAGNVVGTCLCSDGSKGLLMPGFHGECVCNQQEFIYRDT